MSEGIFKLERKDDPLTLTIIHTREAACEDGRLKDGAARLFCRLLDLSLNPSLNSGKRGRVIISQRQLTDRLKCSRRSVQRWIEELVEQKYVRVTFLPRPNCWPVCRFHIVALDEAKPNEERPGEGLWGNHARRSRQPIQGGDGKFVTLPPLLVDSSGKPVSSFLLAKSHERRQKVPLRGDSPAAAPASLVTHGRSKSAAAPASLVTPHRGKFGTAPEQIWHRRGGAGGALKRDSVGGGVPLREGGRGTPPPPLGRNPDK